MEAYVDEFVDACVEEFMDAIVEEFMDACVEAYLDTCAHLFADVCMEELKNDFMKNDFVDEFSFWTLVWIDLCMR